MNNLTPKYTRGEEIANSISHGLGVVLSLGALSVITVFAALRGTAWHVVSCVIYGVTLVLLYLASTLYHALPGERLKKVFKAIDHASIYLLIAGTYTPFLLVPLRGPWGWSLFGVIWGVALGGVIFKVFFAGRFKGLSLALYLSLGWMALIALRPLVQALSRAGLIWLVIGGLCYTLGVGFYILPRRYAHAIWHLFVLAGSAAHFTGVMVSVIPWN
jgi:hemolysin III